MNRHQNRITAVEKGVTIVAILFLLASCSQVYSTAKIKESHIVKVGDGIYRGPRMEDLSELQSLKIRTILNLEDDAEAVQKESETSVRLGITMINIPMSDIFRPRPSDLLRAVKIMEDEWSHPIYVHCRRGRDRTGFVIAAYRIMHHGWNVEKAYQEALDSGHSWWFYDSILGWKESLRFIANGKTGVQAIP